MTRDPAMGVRYRCDERDDWGRVSEYLRPGLITLIEGNSLVSDADSCSDVVSSPSFCEGAF
jgi:hypothetical protein